MSQNQQDGKHQQNCRPPIAVPIKRLPATRCNFRFGFEWPFDRQQAEYKELPNGQQHQKRVGPGFTSVEYKARIVPDSPDAKRASKQASRPIPNEIPNRSYSQHTANDRKPAQRHWRLNICARRSDYPSQDAKIERGLISICSRSCERLII